MRLNDIYEAHKDRVAFYCIYVREAHPDNGWRVPDNLEAGIHVVHGHSSHHFKGIEVYRNRPILYGCGDFLNDYEGIGGHRRFRGELALMYFPILDPATGDLLSLDLLIVTAMLTPVWETRERIGWEYGTVPVVSRAGLVTMKRLRSSGQDLDDIRMLEAEDDAD